MRNASKPWDPLEEFFAEIKNLRSARDWEEHKNVLDLVAEIDRAIVNTQEKLRKLAY